MMYYIIYNNFTIGKGHYKHGKILLTFSQSQTL